MKAIELIAPDWPAPSRVRACATTRRGGVSEGRFSGLNLALHVEDEADRVRANRALLKQALDLPAEPVWLEQVHGVRVIDVGEANLSLQADAAFTSRPGVVCSVMTADCLPLLLCDRQGTRVAAAHAGWRGLQAGVIEQTVSALGLPADQLLAWLGPAIGPEAFEVGDEVRQAFMQTGNEAEVAFRPARPGHWWADIYQLARQRLHGLGIESVYGGGLCTYQDEARFYSYRRAGRTGRMASLIWMTGEQS